MNRGGLDFRRVWGGFFFVLRNVDVAAGGSDLGTNTGLSVSSRGGGLASGAEKALNLLCTGAAVAFWAPGPKSAVDGGSKRSLASLPFSSAFALVSGTVSMPLLVVVVAVVTVALLSRSPNNSADAPEPERARPLTVGVALRRDIIVIDITDIADPGRGLGLGLGGPPPSESVLSELGYASASTRSGSSREGW